MPTVDIGKYQRPGIFIEEFNNTAIETPAVTGIQSLVIGSSKKGPLNTPVVINSQIQLERIFGSIDRSLEGKGSFFHRTISRVLQNTPVVAMNIVDLDDDLDQIEYKSLSTSTGFQNDVIRIAPYSRFFNTSAFWEKDREAFLSVTDDNPNDENRIMHFTNLNDRQVTMFIVKAQNSDGFDQTLLEWYGSVDNVPLYLDPNDFASDYLVDVVMLSGDWTNYTELSVDPIWSQYFSNEGLVKSELFNLVNNPSINTLGVFRNLSVIPYFTDANNTNIFIEDRINLRTDETGIYMAFDIDAVETTYRNGLLDLVGNNIIADNSIERIELLSYNDDITETNSYTEKQLDSLGNTYQLTFGSYYQEAGQERKAAFAEDFVIGLIGPSASEIDGTYPSGIGYGTYSVDFGTTSVTIGAEQPYAIIGGQALLVEATDFDFIPDDFTTNSTSPGTTQSFQEVFFIDTDGGIKNNPNNNDLANGIVLGYVDIVVALDADRNKYFQSVDYTPVSVDDNGFIYFDNSTDVTVSVNTNQNAITYEFLNTTGVPDVSDYIGYRKWKTYNNMSGVLSSSVGNRATILVDEGSSSNGNPWKRAIADLDVTLVTSSTQNKAITIGGFDTGFLNSSILETNGLVLHALDDEFVISSGGAITTNNWIGATYGVVAEWSDLYQDYIDGNVNTGDYFYENLIDGLDNTPESSELNYLRLLDIDGNDYLISDQELNLQTNDTIILPESTSNTGELIVADPTPIDSGLTGATGAYFGYLLSSNITDEVIVNPTKIWLTTETGQKFVRFYFIDDILTIDFTDASLNPGATTFNKTIDIISQSSNFRQTVEVEEPAGYTPVSNKILVDATRYAEIRIGDFLQAVVPETTELGEVPRQVTRVIGKRTYSEDVSLVEITCDSAIRLYDFNGDKQTYRFTQIDDYVSTYKGINLFGFRLRTASLPDNTDSRLTDILNVVGKGTPLFNALTDKDIIDFRYLIDSYGLGLTSNSKQQLADICGKRLDCFGILNMPSIKQFRNASSPSFTDDRGAIRFDYIRLGGNPEAVAGFNFSLAEGDGQTCVAYFTPYVTIGDNGRPISLPPSSFVANTFLRKHNNTLTSVTPWTIAAGITDGQITGISGLEYNLTGEDITELNQMSVNPIVSKRNRGNVIETENTAESLVNSALSFIHSREVLIELERDLSDMLLQFQWKFNTPEIRAEIKLRADTICQDYVNRNGLFNFFNKIDSENNTQEIIDNQIGVLDTYVEIIKGMGVIVNNITILNTGAIDSSGFQTN